MSKGQELKCLIETIVSKVDSLRKQNSELKTNLDSMNDELSINNENKLKFDETYEGNKESEDKENNVCQEKIELLENMYTESKGIIQDYYKKRKALLAEILKLDEESKFSMDIVKFIGRWLTESRNNKVLVDYPEGLYNCLKSIKDNTTKSFFTDKLNKMKPLNQGLLDDPLNNNRCNNNSVTKEESMKQSVDFNSTTEDTSFEEQSTLASGSTRFFNDSTLMMPNIDKYNNTTNQGIIKEPQNPRFSILNFTQTENDLSDQTIQPDDMVIDEDDDDERILSQSTVLSGSRLKQTTHESDILNQAVCEEDQDAADLSLNSTLSSIDKCDRRSLVEDDDDDANNNAGLSQLGFDYSVCDISLKDMSNILEGPGVGGASRQNIDLLNYTVDEGNLSCALMKEDAERSQCPDYSMIDGDL